MDYKGTRYVGYGDEPQIQMAMMTIIKEAEKDLRELMNIPDNYKVLFLQGGASSSSSPVIPMNLMKNKKAGYIITGQWAKKALCRRLRFTETP